ncbi:hypothetical protein EDD85DRAFT_255754 [Armillaria nabsnona]|nr:hypothetical protein EDD85DRAFT_255754 [Armillaria nabsnona]
MEGVCGAGSGETPFRLIPLPRCRPPTNIPALRCSCRMGIDHERLFPVFSWMPSSSCPCRVAVVIPGLSLSQSLLKYVPLGMSEECDVSWTTSLQLVFLFIFSPCLIAAVPERYFCPPRRDFVFEVEDDDSNFFSAYQCAALFHFVCDSGLSLLSADQASRWLDEIRLHSYSCQHYHSANHDVASLQLTCIPLGHETIGRA